MEQFGLIKLFPDKDWCWYSLSRHPNLPIELVLENMDKSWNWWQISKHMKISMKVILNNLDKSWNWNYLSANPNISMRDVLENPDQPWIWNLLLTKSMYKSIPDIRVILCAYTIPNLTDIIIKYTF